MSVSFAWQTPGNRTWDYGLGSQWSGASGTAVADPIDVEDTADSIESEFATLADQWQQETADISSITKRVLHPAYQRIIGLGSDAIPLLLKRLETSPNLWFHALRNVSGDDPVKPAQRGDIREMTRAWLAWGRERGYLR